MVKAGELWGDSNNKNFRVIHVVEVDGHTWVHYREDKGFKVSENNREYSCYIESFLSRFRKLPE